ncbi:MAG: VWA domain-containing protein [Candidatus Edwardsbacteria bacterium]|nr:VWA domain-containing protein [Candidatus Edwardsbacteria bacterium]
MFQEPPGTFSQLKKAFFKFLNKISRLKSRTVRGSKKRRSVISDRSGRNIKIVRFRAGENTLAPLQTVVSSLISGKYSLSRKEFSIGPGDFVGWEKLERQSMTLVLLVDVSRSTFPFIKIFAEILDSLTGYFKLHQDRIGLISLQGMQAKILNHPTHNYRVITKGLMGLKVRGESPLADGLLKALAMVRLEKFRKPGSTNLVILLSDGYPEPLTAHCPDIFDEPAYRETIRAASLYRQQALSLLMINPSFRNQDQAKFMPGEKLSTIIARESRGKLIKLFRDPNLNPADRYYPPTRSEIRQILNGIEGMMGNKTGSERERSLAI